MISVSCLTNMLVKVFSLPSKAVIGSLSTCSDIQRLAVNNDFIFSATKSGTIEVWLQERVTKITSIKMKSGGQTKITSLAVDKDGEMIFAGSTDGKIQVKCTSLSLYLRVFLSIASDSSLHC